MQIAHVLTANRLTDGIAVWYDRDGKWNEWIGRSVVANSKEEAEQLETIGKKAFAANGIKFAFPTVQVAGGSDSDAAVARQAVEMVKPAEASAA